MVPRKLKVQRSSREVIENRLLASLKDEAKVAIVIGRDELLSIINALEKVPRPTAEQRSIVSDLRRLNAEAFARPI